MSGNPKFHYYGAFAVRDVRRALTAHVAFEDAKTASRSGAHPDGARVRIVKSVGEEEVTFAEGNGYWTRYLQFGDRLYWRVSDAVDAAVEDPLETCLPSASGARREIALIAARRFEEADGLLTELELADDKDAARRKKGAAKR